MIYDDKKSPGPLGKPEAIKIPASVRWDPTDPSAKNPFAQKTPTISGIKNLAISWGKEVDLKKGVKAKSTVGLDITSRLKVNASINPYRAGDYAVEYSVMDALGRTKKKTITVTVKTSKTVPIFEGIGDRVIDEDTAVDRDFALQGVRAFCSGTELDPSEISVKIKNTGGTKYIVTYKISVGDGISASETATFQVDDIAPTIDGVADRQLEQEQVPDEEMALEGVTVTDNFTALSPEDILVTIEEEEDGSFLVTYAVEDDFGNEAVMNATFYY